jgi:hypothetical protein
VTILLLFTAVGSADSFAIMVRMIFSGVLEVSIQGNGAFNNDADKLAF